MAKMTYRSGARLAVVAFAVGGAALVGVSGVIVGGCAKGGENTEDGDGGDNTGDGGEGGFAGMGGMGGMGGDGGDGGGLVCDEDPCRLVGNPQCGCAAGDHCTVTMDGLRVCAPEGDKGPLEYCAPGQCQGDHFCFNNGGTGIGGICHQFCEEDTDCTTPLIGGICAYVPSGGGAKLCTNKCDLLSNTGCKELNSFLKCDIGRETGGSMRWFTRCINTGSVPAQGDCSSASCEAGTSCVNIQGEPFPKCLPWCEVGGVACAVGQCVELTVNNEPILIDGMQFGGCLQ